MVITCISDSDIACRMVMTCISDSDIACRMVITCILKVVSYSVTVLY